MRHRQREFSFLAVILGRLCGGRVMGASLGDKALKDWDEVLGVFSERSPCGDCFEALQTTVAKDRQLPVIFLETYFKKDTMAPLKVWTHYFGN
jgi:hypothetical protein